MVKWHSSQTVQVKRGVLELGKSAQACQRKQVHFKAPVSPVHLQSLRSSVKKAEIRWRQAKRAAI